MFCFIQKLLCKFAFESSIQTKYIYIHFSTGLPKVTCFISNVIHIIQHSIPNIIHISSYLHKLAFHFPIFSSIACALYNILFQSFTYLPISSQVSISLSHFFIYSMRFIGEHVIHTIYYTIMVARKKKHQKI